MSLRAVWKVARWCASWVTVALFVSCAGDRGKTGEATEATGRPGAGQSGAPSANGIPPALRNGGGFGGTPIGPDGGFPDDLEESAGVVLSSEDIVFTDPDADDPGDLPELQDLLQDAQSSTTETWRQSFQEVMQDARVIEKPVLIWFTSSRGSPPSRALGEELFNQQDFEAWARETFIRLQVEDSGSPGGISEGDEVRKADYVEQLKERFDVRGTPTLVVLDPSGKVAGRYKGYRRGRAEYKWGQLRQAAHLAKESYSEWKRRMEEKGYRFWTGQQGNRLMAKLVSYRDGEMLLVEPDGRRFQTKEEHLSDADRQWIAAEKRKRGMN